MTKFFLAALLAVCVFWIGCSEPSGISGPTPVSGNALSVKVPGTELSMTIKSSAVRYGNIISTFTDKPQVQTSNHYVVLANYEVPNPDFGSVNRPLVKDSEIKVAFAVTGVGATKDDTPFVVGSYDPQAQILNKVRSFSVTTFTGGSEKTTECDTMGSAPKCKGSVKITSVTADSVSGEIDVNQDGLAVKGNFTAKLPVKK